MNTINYSDIINVNNNDIAYIIKTKIHTNSDKYFSLFDKHIPTNLKSDSKILLFTISNIGVISRIIAKNPNCKYYIFDISCIFNAINNKYNNGNMYNITIEDIFNSDMKFDCIIMNPPYNKNLHLKILEEAITHLKDDNSVCVNLSPVRWLQDPLAKYKKHSDYNKFEESISKHIEYLDVISAKDANNIFIISNFTDIGIYLARKYQIKSFNYKEFNELKFAKCKTIKDKILSYVINDEKHTYNNYLTTNDDGYRVVLTLITGQRGEQQYKRFYECSCRTEIFKDGKDIFTNKKYSDICGGIKKAKANKLNKSVSLGLTVNFKTENEAKNFIKYCKLNCMTFCGMITKNDMHPQFKFLPWLGDAINPRTGLKGYESEWTNEDFYKFFNITEEEQKIIEEVMSQYK